MKFVARCVANQPEVTIEGRDIKHILSSRYFTTFTYDGKFKVVEEEGTVYITKQVRSSSDGQYNRMVIGWIKDKE